MKIRSRSFVLAAGAVFSSLNNSIAEVSNVPKQLRSTDHNMIKSNVQLGEISITKLEDNEIDNKFNGLLALNFKDGQFKGLEGIAWSVDTGIQIHLGTFQFKLFSSFDDDIHLDEIDKPYLLPSVNWLMNNYPSGGMIENQEFRYLCKGGKHMITDEEFQLAVSMVIDDYENAFDNWPNDADTCVVEYMVTHAEMNQDYKVNCNEKNAHISLLLVKQDNNDDPGIIKKQVLVAKLNAKSVCNRMPDTQLDMPVESTLVTTLKSHMTIENEVANSTADLQANSPIDPFVESTHDAPLHRPLQIDYRSNDKDDHDQFRSSLPIF